MTGETLVESRLAALEREVAELKSRLAAQAPVNWVQQMAGSMKDMPDFDKVVEYGREWRRAYRSDDDPPLP